jgi:hypothetical protein
VRGEIADHVRTVTPCHRWPERKERDGKREGEREGGRERREGKERKGRRQERISFQSDLTALKFDTSFRHHEISKI